MKENIMFIIPTLSSGGAEKTVVNLSTILKDDYNVIIVVFNDNGSVKLDKKVKLINLGINQTKKPIKKVYLALKKIHMLKKIKKSNNVKCCISFLKRPSLLNVLSHYKEKTIVSFRNKMSEQDKSYISKTITKFICKKSNEIISLSNMVKHDLINEYKAEKDKISVIYNPCDIDYINKRKKEPIEDDFKKQVEGKRILLNIGRLTKQKAQKNLILSFKKISEEFPESILLILGKGEEEENLRLLIKKLGLNGKVIIKGFVENPYKYMSISEIFIFSSIYEGLGNALLEAAGAGMALISTDCKYGPREIISPNSNLFIQSSKVEYCDYGVLVPSFESFDEKDDKKIELLYEAIKKLLKNKSLLQKYRKSALMRAKDFSPEIIKKQWIEVINK